MKTEFQSSGPDETQAIAAKLLAVLPSRAVLALHGDLGSGKTCFVQGLARGLGIEDPVTSPTFTVINEYRGRGDRLLFHIDLYRLETPDDVLALGFEEYIDGEGITAVEWPERAGELLPDETVHVRIVARGAADDDRVITIEGPSTPVV